MANLKASDNPFPSILLEEHVDPATPASGHWRLFMDTDNTLKKIDDTGAVTSLEGAAASVATDAIWDAAGDLVQGTGSNTAAKLSAGTAGMFLKSAGAAAANLWAYAPGSEMDYAQTTSTLTVTATTEGTAETFVSGNAVAYDGSTVVMVECYLEFYYISTTAKGIYLWLYDGSSSIGMLGYFNSNGTDQYAGPLRASRRLTPSAATHTYSIRASKDSGTTAQVVAGAGGTGAGMPGFIRITRV